MLQWKVYSEPFMNANRIFPLQQTELNIQIYQNTLMSILRCLLCGKAGQDTLLITVWKKRKIERALEEVEKMLEQFKELSHDNEHLIEMQQNCYIFL